MDYFKQFKTAILNNNYPTFLNLWEEYCASDEIDGEELKQILESVKESSFAEAFGRYVEHILPVWEKIEDPKLAHKTLCLIYDIQNVNSPELAQRALAYLEKHYSKDSLFQEKLRYCGLREQTQFQGALSQFDLLNHLDKGNFVFHTGGWGVGEIIDVSWLREQITLEFDYVSGAKDFSFKNAFKTLIPISKDHFLAMRFGTPDKLEAWAKKDPIAVIHLLLRDLGPKTAGEIKDEMCDLVIPQDEWTRWWQTTRNKLKKDTMVVVPEDLKDSFSLRTAEISHEDRLLKSLEKNPSVDELIQMVYNFIRDFPGALKNPQFSSHLDEKLVDVLKNEVLSDHQELQIHFFLEDLRSDHKEAKELISRFKNIAEIVSKIDIIAFKKRTLVDIKEIKSDWVDIFLSLLFEIEQSSLRDYILNELVDAKKISEVEARLTHLTQHPHEHPSAVLWYLQKVMQEEERLPMSNQEGKNRLFEAFLSLFYLIEQQKEQRDLLKRMHLFLTTGRFANVRKIFHGASKEDVLEFLLLATKCHTITDHDKKILHSLAEVVHPSLSKFSKKYSEEEENSYVIWTTEEGFCKLKERVHQIATVETIENAKQIEIARSYGDLRENAEYKSALEQRARLQSELKSLSNQLQQARILSREDVLPDVAGVGTVVNVTDERGENAQFTILGPWDADPSHNIFSFQSKVAQEMNGKRVGDHFDLSGHKYTIKAISNYFDRIKGA